MTRKLILTLVAIFFIAASLGLSYADEGPNGNKRKGKYTYRKVYQSCSERGEVESKTPPISPSDKTMDQWKHVFETKDFSEFKCSEEWSKLSDEDILDIYSYLYSAAADSPTPAKCK
ncbi:MAG: cytochrome c family protein [Pseudomonadota bacterium]